jgi:YD repeat-containing protein
LAWEFLRETFIQQYQGDIMRVHPTPPEWIRITAMLRAATFLAILMFVFALPAHAQITNVTDQTSRPAPGTGHDLVHSLNDTVNPANGSLAIRMPVSLPPGRRLTIPFSFAYDSGSAGSLQPSTPKGTTWGTNQSSFAYGGWSYALPTLSRTGVTYNYTGNGTQDNTKICQATTSYMFTDPHGAMHELGMSHLYSATLSPLHLNDACSYSGYQEYDIGSDDPFFAAALVGPFLDPHPSTAPQSEGTPTTATPDGTTFKFNGGTWICGSGSSPSNSGFPSSVTDRNGNNVSISGTPFEQCNTLSITDTLGRTAISAPFAVTGTSNVSVAGLSQPYKVTWGTAGANYTFSANQVQPDPNCGLVSGAGNSGANPGASNVVTSIQLPNGQGYQFAYDSTYGQVNKITYPSGGYVSFTWGLNPLASIIQFNDFNGAVGACIYTYDVPAVVKRVVSFDGVMKALEQDFSYSTTWGTGSQQFLWTQKTTTIVTKDLIRGTNSTTVYTYVPTYNPWAPNTKPPSFSNILSPQEQSIQYYDTNGALLNTVTKGWLGKDLLGCELNTLPNGLVAGAFYTYGPGGQVTDVKKYDYGQISSASACLNGATAPSGITPLSETVTAYQVFPAPSWYPTPIILDRACKVLTYGTGTLVAETDFYYDGSTNLCGSGASVGNATKIVKRCLQSAPLCTSGDSITTYAYDSAGQVTSMTDACGNATCSDMQGSAHTTTYSYTDSYASCGGSAPPSSPSDAYLTQVTYPQTNGVSHIVSYCYDYTTGLLLSSKDENNQPTAYVYNDALHRLTETDLPDLGQTTITYKIGRAHV